MLILTLQFLLLAATIVVAGTYLAAFSDAIAEITGMGRTLAGVILLALATSLPELAVDCSFALIPVPNQAVGALVGSSLFNLLILASLDLFHRSRGQIFSPLSVGHAISAVASIILTSIVVLSIAIREFSLQWHGIGIGPVMIMGFYLWSLRLVYLDQRIRGEEQLGEAPEASARGTLARAMLGYIVTTTVIFVAASYLAPTAERLADRTGLGDTFVGSTFVALTTSLPELVTTAAAVRMGAFDLAVGNVLGSNTFNMVILFPVDVVYRQGAILQDVESSHMITASIVILITAIATISLLFRPRKRYWLLDPGPGLVVILALLALFALYQLTPVAGG